MLCVDGGNVNGPITPKERERERRLERERRQSMLWAIKRERYNRFK